MAAYGLMRRSDSFVFPPGIDYDDAAGNLPWKHLPGMCDLVTICWFLPAINVRPLVWSILLLPSGPFLHPLSIVHFFALWKGLLSLLLW